MCPFHNLCGRCPLLSLVTCGSSRREEIAPDMCGIFGYVGTRDEAPQLVLAGLKKLEYRGYDSWGIASRQNDDHLARLVVEKHTGKIGQAMTSLPASHAALAHTRCATHRRVTEAHAHPT